MQAHAAELGEKEGRNVAPVSLGAKCLGARHAGDGASHLGGDCLDVIPAEGLLAHVRGVLLDQEQNHGDGDQEEDNGELPEAGAPARALDGGRDKRGHDGAGKAGAGQGHAHGKASLFNEPVGEDAGDGHAGEQALEDSVDGGNDVKMIDVGGQRVAPHAAGHEQTAQQHEGLKAPVFEKFTPERRHQKARHHTKRGIHGKGGAPHLQVFRAGHDKGRKGVGENADGGGLDKHAAGNDYPAVKKTGAFS